MFTHKIDEEVSLRLFNEDDTEEFYNLTISSKTYLKKWLDWLDYIESIKDAAKNIKFRPKESVENGRNPKSVAIISGEEIAGTIGFKDISKSNKIIG
ncbi:MULTISPECIES: hypothetical protein [Bacillus]|uniref:hypothetical protein n=1 Tax=Bacillus TaxID=1386 RepID=UPI0005A30306|nr:MULTISPECIES: hypothetical protein [Bacillus cereus group]AJG58153.1 putative ribosomal-protein-serine N-acetyltransferase [Bacillus cereus D17]MCU5058965.1 hypothetical protein [Bacillus cereus]USL04265.1 hypothetical protein LIS83_09520 [Bacillus anthracis]SEJ69311.1 ribosomal-protein-serine acetyltransferase [Bacillus thuringiensis]SME21201.1 ribosomal-protein-L7/L12-serine acetyltransferase [Bacillus cereus]